MKPPRFEYYDPATLHEAVALFSRLGDEAKVLAGGQSLVPLLNMRLARPKALVDLNRIADLRYIRVEGDQLRIGAMTRHSEVEHSRLVRERCPLLHEAVGYIGHTAIRNRGTIGGSLAHADPAAELPAVSLVLDGEMVATGPGGSRTIPAADFFTMYFATSLSPEEILTEIRLPLLPLGTGTAFVELARRDGDFAIVGVACYLGLDGSGRIERAGVALSGVGATPVRAGSAEALLLGRSPSEALFEEAGRAVSEVVEPESDIHASAEYRKHVAGVMTVRALRKAHERVRQAERGGGSER